MEDDVLLPLLTELMDVCRVNHFPQGNDLRTTLFKNLVGMAHGLGKKRFKRHYFELVTELLFATLEVEHGPHSSNFRTDDARDGNQLAIHAAEKCCEELSELVGSMIFRGRLDDGQQEVYDSVIQKRRRDRQSPGPVGDMGLVMGRDAFAGGFGGSSRPTRVD
eukprot:CAMPEP_0194424418 /NCGR_PEP_ID=MMETSP0176-20130528/23691_1 /TAXON_ID=216777 /ORGANISM="Proboscia alata, Strain PI-D3" /LENGTH=162 /DNA_ID=CAMNT_0039234167 /DNA_START=104 /DNA_END=592 /DNA_ORIENTATION=+